MVTLRQLSYRPDIDCLRAFAVISVIAYHYDISPFRSGYVGVDVFFVISGFLITRILRTEILAGTFSIANFYRRRVRRILPAAFAMLGTVLVCSSVLLLPQDTVSVAHQALAVVTFSSNVLFWSQQGYFDAASITKPLLHTWSLAVEEQYYLLFPAAAVAAFALRRSLTLLSFVIAALASFAICVLQTPLQPASAFYLLPARIWEFALGALLAIEALPEPAMERLRIVAAAAGWIALGASANVFSPRTPYPGAAALLPCLGAAMVIWANPTPSKAVLTATKPMITVGLWSYSLYLWHWPLLSLTYAAWGPPTSGFDKFVLVACCTALSIASYHLIEQPARRAEWRITWRSLGATGIAAVAFAAVMIWSAGFPFRFSPQELTIAGFLDYNYRPVYEERTCFLDPAQSVEDLAPSCVAPTTKPNLFVWGDSHAAHLTHGLRQVLRPDAVLRATMAGCLPALSYGQPARCAPFNRRVLALIDEIKPDVVLISGDWARSVEAQQTRQSLLAAIGSITASGSRVIVVGPGLQYDAAMPRLVVSAMHFGAAPDSHLLSFVRSSDDILRNLLKDIPETEYISPVRLLCPNATCPTLASGAPIAWDQGHLTAQGSVLLATQIVETSASLKLLLEPPPTTESP
ncbi:acyltransferase family protein [Bradyrhizobium sp. HKCCYLS1011]|uniref:acyltransferase family protein n=1 Tax=Bradyrhizobium sp. HKCCYLS1011 TaxID=3420733 RepID=UPI003EBE6F65